MLRPLVPASLCRSATLINTPIRRLVNTYKTTSSSFSSSVSTNKNNAERLTDPRSYIRHFATTTPAYEPATSPKQFDSSFLTLQQQNRANSQPRSYAHELRDTSLTQTQRYANQFKKSVLNETEPPSGSLERLKQLKEQEERKNDQLGSLIRNMEYSMRSGRGAAGDNICSRCEGNIDAKNPGCTALERTFHVSCFTCEQCGGNLAGGSFYNVNGKAICEKDYEESLERCAKCGNTITEKLLRASGNAYHPSCFQCTSCLKCLDGVAFTLNAQGDIHCVDCFHDKYAPRCAMCSRPIIPEAGEKDSVRVIAMDKSFHVGCYRCEDCGLQLSSQIEGHGCYPLDQHLYCKNCNSKRLTAIAQSAR
uniref:LIM domain-containing protein n=1 Tax=Steinernema glaseri TaxID=37863 RepID=A0A1I7YGZ7_9BILA